MEIKEEILNENIFKIILSGRMDVDGVGKIEKDFSSMTNSPRMSIIVDMSDVPYMSSIGIRALLINAKSVSGRGGKYVLLNPQLNVKNVLEVSGIDQLIEVCTDLNDAISRVKP